MIQPILTLTPTELRLSNSLLRKRSKRVEYFDARLNDLITNLVDTLDNHEIAVGLSAVQIGALLRVCVVDMDKIAAAKREKQKRSGKLMLINPEIVMTSRSRCKEIEACMSLPSFAGAVERPERIRIAFQTIDGANRQIIANGLLARVLLHELDHMDGVLYTDRMSPADKLLPVEFC